MPRGRYSGWRPDFSKHPPGGGVKIGYEKSEKSPNILQCKKCLSKKNRKKFFAAFGGKKNQKRKKTLPSAAKRSEKRPCFGTSSTFKGLHPTRANQPRKVLPKPPVCAAGGGADGKATWQLPKHSLHHIHAMPVPSAHSSKQARPQTAVQCNVFLVFSPYILCVDEICIFPQIVTDCTKGDKSVRS